MKCARDLKKGDRVKVLRIGKMDAHYESSVSKQGYASGWVGSTGIIEDWATLTKRCGRFYVSCSIVWDIPKSRNLNSFLAVILEKYKEEQP